MHKNIFTKQSNRDKERLSSSYYSLCSLRFREPESGALIEFAVSMMKRRVTSRLERIQNQYDRDWKPTGLLEKGLVLVRFQV